MCYSEGSYNEVDLYYIISGFSGADMATLCREAALGPIRDMSFGDIENISADQVMYHQKYVVFVVVFCGIKGSS